MRYILLLLSIYLIFWNYIDLNIYTIPYITNLLPTEFEQKILVYLIFWSIILFIIEEIINYIYFNKRDSYISNILYLFPVWVWIFSLLISLEKLSNSIISGVDFLLFILVSLLLSHIVLLIYKRILKIFITKFKEAYFDIIFILLFWFLFNYFLLEIICFISLNENIILYYIFMVTIFIVVIYLVINKEWGYLLLVRKSVKKTQIAKFASKLELQYALTDELKDKFKSKKSHSFKEILEFSKEIVKNVNDYRFNNKLIKTDVKNLILDEKLEIKIPKNIKIIQKEDDTFIFSGWKKSYIEAIYWWEIQKIPIKIFNEIIKEFSIKKEFYESLEDKRGFIEKFLGEDLWQYIKQENLESSELLNNFWVDDIKNEEELNAYFLWFSKNWDIENIKRILTKYPDLNIDKIDNRTGYNPLLIATAEKQIAMVRYLLQKGACPDVKTVANGASPLAIASQYGFIEIIKLLVQFWANKNIKDDWGKTPLMQASMFGHNNIVTYLVQEWANRKIRDKSNFSAYDYAKQKKYWEIIKILLKK